MHPIRALLARSAAATEGRHSIAEVNEWLHDCVGRNCLTDSPIPLAAMPGWQRDPSSGDYQHSSGEFFRITGCQVERAEGVTRQPILLESGLGIVGFLIKQFSGVIHLLTQLRAEPGFPGGPQLTPTIQAGSGNIGRNHGGRGIPYLDYFRNPRPRDVVVDTVQSEQGWWFANKRNRNVVVWTQDDVAEGPDFCWLTLGQLFQFLDSGDLMSFETRALLNYLPYRRLDPASGPTFGPDPNFAATASILNRARTATATRTRLIPLNQVWDWHATGDRFQQSDAAAPFEIVGRRVQATGRETSTWAQPMLRPIGMGHYELLFRTDCGAVEVLLSLSTEPGLPDDIEFGPTIRPWYHHGPRLPELGRSRVRYDRVHSHDGSRCYAARSRCVIRELVSAAPTPAPPGFAWLTVDVMAGLVAHPGYLSVEARSLLSCLHRVLRADPHTTRPLGTAPGAGTAQLTKRPAQ